MKTQAILAFILWANTLFAQNQIKGEVQDINSNFALLDAIIQIKERDRPKIEFKVRPDSNGVFMATDIPDGIYNITCSAPKYAGKKIVELPIKGGINKQLIFRLRQGNPNDIELIMTYASLQAELQRPVTTASLSENSQTEAPATVYVVTAEDIERRGYSSLLEVLDDIPEVEIQHRANFYTHNVISMRGIEGGKKFIILLDGIRISSFTSPDVTLDKNISIRYAQQIEVLLGPAAALYGSDAVSGVINIITQKPKSNSIAASSSYGSFNSSDNALAIGLTKNGFSFFANGSAYLSQEPNLPKYYRSDFDWYWNRYQTDGVMHPFGDSSNLISLPIKEYATPRYAYWTNAKMSYKGWELGFHRDWQKHNMAISGRSDLTLAWKEYATITSRTHAYLSNDFASPNKKWQLRSLLNWNWYELSPKTTFADSYNRYSPVYSYSFNHTWQLNETFSYVFNKNHQLQAGLSSSYTYELPNGSRILPIQPARGQLPATAPLQYYAGSQVTWQDGRDTQITQIMPYTYQINAGIFVQYQANIKDKLFVTAGMRFDYFVQQQQQYPAFNPRIGLVYKPHQYWSLKGFYGESFMAPALETMYGDFTSIEPVLDSSGYATGYNSSYAFIPNLNLKPEKMRTGELSALFSKDNWLLGLNTYINYLSNAVVVRAILDTTYLNMPVSYGEQNINGASLLTYGGTARLGYRFSFGLDNENAFEASVAYSFSHGRSTDLEGDISNFVPYSAQHTVKGNFSFKYKGWGINLRVLYRSRSYDAGIYNENDDFVVRYNQPFAVLNLYSYYKILKAEGKRPGLSIFVKIQNLSNNRYYNTSYNYADTFFAAPQDPIRIMGGLSFSFGE